MTDSFTFKKTFLATKKQMSDEDFINMNDQLICRPADVRMVYVKGSDIVVEFRFGSELQTWFVPDVEERKKVLRDIHRELALHSPPVKDQGKEDDDDEMPELVPCPPAKCWQDLQARVTRRQDGTPIVVDPSRLGFTAFPPFGGTTVAFSTKPE